MANKLHELQPADGSRTRKRRVGRGIGSGSGKTCGRGTKGQKAKTNINPKFEGGQTPIHRRLPVKKGFRNPNHVEYAVINVGDLESAVEGSEFSPEVGKTLGLIGTMKDGLKILGGGDLKKKLKVSAHRFSKSAEEKIVKAGGEVVRL